MAEFWLSFESDVVVDVRHGYDGSVDVDVVKVDSINLRLDCKVLK
jgi:hypothetical protein